MTPIDVFDDLRRERPSAAQDPALGDERAHTALTRARNGFASPAPTIARRPRWSFAVAATLMLAALVAVMFNPTDPPHQDPTRPVERVVIEDVSDGEARQIVLVALKQAADAVNLDLTQRWRSVEVAPPHRVDERTIRTIIIGEGLSEERSSQDDFAQKQSDGLETRFVDDTWYFEYAGDRFKQRWMYDVRMHGNSGGLGLNSVDQAKSFRPDLIAKQLELEGLATVRRTKDGGFTLEVERAASELAPVAGSGGLDPIGSSTFRLAASDPTAPVHVRIDVAPNHELRRVSVSYVGDVAQRSGPGQTTQIRSRVTNEVELRPTDGRAITKPDPSDVMVVGDPSMTRLGEGGLAGPHGTLEELDESDLKALLEDLRDEMRSGPPGFSPPKPTAAELARRRADLERVIAAYRAYEPIDRHRFIDDPACTPYWPASRRRMDDATVRDNPRLASWHCTLADGRSSFTLRPRDHYGMIQARVGTAWIGFRADHAEQVLRSDTNY